MPWKTNKKTGGKFFVKSRTKSKIRVRIGSNKGKKRILYKIGYDREGLPVYESKWVKKSHY